MSLNDVVYRWGLSQSPPLRSYDQAKNALLAQFGGQQGLISTFPGLTFNAALYEAASGPATTLIVDQFGEAWVEDGLAVVTRDLSYFGGL
jgi:hypothetical protein